MAGKKSADMLSLAPVLDLNEATALRDKLMSMRGRDVSIDASGVQRLGALCAQVLAAADKTWDQDKRSLTFTDVSEAFEKTMQLIGVDIAHLLGKEIKQ